MKKFFAVSLLSVFLFLIVGTQGAQQAAAFTATSGESVSLKSPVNDDLYSVGKQVDIDQPVMGDVTIVGGDIDINEDVAGDVTVLGGKVSIYGNVGDDVRVVGGTVVVIGNIKDDLIAIGGNIELGRTASVGGSVLTHGGTVSIDGNVAENVTGSAMAMKIKGWVNGNVQIDAREFLGISPSAKIRGDLRYSSESLAEVPAGVVGGKTERIAPSHSHYKGLILGFYSAGMLIGALWNLLSLLVIGGVLFLLFPIEFTKRSEMLRKGFWKNLGVGFLGITTGTAFIIFCFMTIVGIPLGLILGFGGFTLWYLSQLVVGMLLGTAILKSKPRSTRKSYGVMALGLFVYSIISLIPIVGAMANFVLVLAAFGVMLRRQYEWLLLLKGGAAAKK